MHELAIDERTRLSALDRHVDIKDESKIHSLFDNAKEVASHLLDPRRGRGIVEVNAALEREISMRPRDDLVVCLARHFAVASLPGRRRSWQKGQEKQPGFSLRPYLC